MQPIKVFNNNRGSAMVFVLAIMMISFSLSFYIIKVSKDLNSSAAMLKDKIDATLEAESLAEIINYTTTTQMFERSHFLIDSKYIDSPKSAIVHLDGKQSKIWQSSINAQDASSKLSIWSIDVKTLERLLTHLKDQNSAITIKDSILDWIDQDNLKHLNGAEAYQYQNFSYAPRNYAAIQSVDELAIIKGVDQETIQLLTPFLTLKYYGFFNINNADKRLLQAKYNLTNEMLSELINLKKQKGYITITDLHLISAGALSVSEDVADFASKGLEIEIISTVGQARQKIQYTLDAIPDDTTPYRIQRWNN